jgi:hypothetical protein
VAVESGTQQRRSASKCSGRGGEERGARMSAVEMARGVAPFYRFGEAIGRGGWPAVVGIQYRLFRRAKGGGEWTGRCHLDGGNEEGGAPVRFGFLRPCGAQRGGTDQGRWRLG